MGLVTVAQGPAFSMCTWLDRRCSVGRGSAGFPVEKGKQTGREERRRGGGGDCRGGAGVSPPESGCPLGCPELTSSQVQTREAALCLLLCSVHTHVLLRSALLLTPGRGTVSLTSRTALRCTSWLMSSVPGALSSLLPGTPEGIRCCPRS